MRAELLLKHFSTKRRQAGESVGVNNDALFPVKGLLQAMLQFVGG
jgi:hypothetical protein